MVKNTTGGSGHKAFARKLVSSGKSNRLRLAQDPSEIYGVITKMYGNGMCQVKTQNNLEMTCHIRGKFRGRNKKQNLVSVSSTVLVGLREWENPVKNCDLLEIYEQEELHMLPFSGTAITNAASGLSSSSTAAIDDIVFSEHAEEMDVSGNRSMYRLSEEEEIEIDDI